MAKRLGVGYRGVLWALVVLAAACVRVPQRTENMQRAGIEELTASQLRDIVLQYAEQFSQAVEFASDSIRAVNDDPRVRYRALLWKVVATRSVREAALVSDPLLGLIDVWLFSVQARMFIESPPVEYEPLPEPYSEVALDVFRQQEALARRLAIDVAGEERVTQFEPRLLAFAAAHPIDPLTLARTSVLAADSVMLRAVGGGVGSALAATYWSVREMDDRLMSVNEALGKELRWNLELLANDLAELPAVDSALGGLRYSLDRIAALADTLPGLVSSERAVVLEALHAELATLTAAIDGMRLETLEAVSAERLAVLRAITEERVVLLEAITRERIATLAAVDSILIGAIDHSEQLVDHIFWRILQLGAVAFVLLVVAVVFVLRMRRPAAAGTQ